MSLLALDVEGNGVMLAGPQPEQELYAADEAAVLLAPRLRDLYGAVVLVARGDVAMREDLAHLLARELGRPVWFASTASHLQTDGRGVARLHQTGGTEWQRVVPPRLPENVPLPPSPALTGTSVPEDEPSVEEEAGGTDGEEGDAEAVTESGPRSPTPRPATPTES
ncbi:hypothetical protein [Streptomyces sp. NPDC094049]|uniref:hypothetical protein n=1 Tax=Streptomyces sp. NPDC094049 TaxID=3154987 RepID=UPI0033274BA2